MSEGNPQRSRLLLLCNGSERQGTARLFQALGTRWRRDGHRVQLVLRDLPRGVLPKLVALVRGEGANLRRLWRSDVLVVHTALSLSIMTVVLARLLGRQVVAFVWDLYPQSTRIVGNIRNRWLLYAYGVTERICMRLATHLLIPSEDYRSQLPPSVSSAAAVYPLWPTGRVVDSLPKREWPAANLTVGFAGQINGIRSLVPAAEALLASLQQDMTLNLHLFSTDPAPQALLDLESRDSRLSLNHHGFVEPAVLSDHFGALHFGLVSIDERFDLPAFPSKIVAYLAAGLPVLYVGCRMPALEAALVDGGIGIVLRDAPLSKERLGRFFAEYSVARSTYFEQLGERWDRFDRLL